MITSLTEISCARPVIKGAVTKSHKRRYHRGDRLVLRCQSGGPTSTLICQSNGKWSGSVPVCDQEQCRKSCQNGGSCTSGNKCICPPGYSGRHCQHGWYNRFFVLFFVLLFSYCYFPIVFFLWFFPLVFFFIPTNQKSLLLLVMSWLYHTFLIEFSLVFFPILHTLYNFKRTQ